MHTKIYIALKQTYASLGLDKTILKGQAASLEATGLVTDENLDAVISAQKHFLEALQSGMDKRVADALAKTNGSDQRKSRGKNVVRRHELQELIEQIVGEKITSLQKQFNNQTKEECESVPASSVRPLVKEHGTSAWPTDREISVTHPHNDRIVGNYMSGARHINAASGGLSNKPVLQESRNEPARKGASTHVADDGYHVLHITEKMIHSEFRKVLMNLINVFDKQNEQTQRLL